MVQKLAWVFAVVFILIGVLGFVPGITTDGYLLGIFEVDWLHNIIHLASGILAAILASSGYASAYFKIFGLVYLAVTILGFMDGSSVLGLFNVNSADNILHLVIAVVSLAIGFGVKERDLMMAPRPM